MTRVKQAAFWRWFAGSQVVDGRGQPLVVYHGTNQPIEKFSKARLGQNTDSASCHAGFYFTENVDEAAEYAAMSARRQVSNAIEREERAAQLLSAMDRAMDRGDFVTYERLCLELEESESEAIHGDECGANIWPAVLAVRNPFLLDMEHTVDLRVMDREVSAARKRGHDGVKLLNVYDPVGARPDCFSTTQWIVFDARQIRSAIEFAPALVAPRVVVAPRLMTAAMEGMAL